MFYNIEIIRNNVVITIKGELDDHFAVQIKEKLDFVLLRKEIRNIVFDLCELEFMDSSGIGLLMGRYRNIKNRGGSAAIICNNEKINKILKMSGILDIFTLFGNKEYCLSEMGNQCEGV